MRIVVFVNFNKYLHLTPPLIKTQDHVQASGCFFLSSFTLVSQNKTLDPSWFKGEHFVIYTKCKTAVIFCENTQQDYTFCGSTRNCNGLFVNPGDTFLVNLENKSQNVNVVGNISFQNYLPPVSNYTFQFVNNCIPPLPLQIVIPLTAVPGSSFQIVAQNTLYDPPQPPFAATIPIPMTIHVGWQQLLNTTALSNFTICPEEVDATSTDVSLFELKDPEKHISLYPNPTSKSIHLISDRKYDNLSVIIYDMHGRAIKIIDAMDEEMEIEELTNGIYNVFIYNGESLIEIKKLVVLKE